MNQLLIVTSNLKTSAMPPDLPDSQPVFRLNQRVHLVGDTRRTGTVKYVGHVEGYPGTRVGVDWDSHVESKHNGSINGIKYFEASSEMSGSFVRPQKLTAGISFLDALMIRYRGTSTKEEEDEMYVLSAHNNRVSVQFLGKEKIEDKLSRFEELTGVSLFYLGVSSCVTSDIISLMPTTFVTSLKELDLTGNLFSDWNDVGTICEQLPALSAINLSNNLMAHDVPRLPTLQNIRTLVLNNTSISWRKVELLKSSLLVVEELHLMGNKISEIQPTGSATVEGFDSLRLINLEDNCISEWNEILKISYVQSLEQLQLNKNELERICYPDSIDFSKKPDRPFQNLRCVLVGNNKIDDLFSIDSLNSFPKLDIRHSENPIADPSRGGIPRFVMIARLAKVKIFNGSEVSPRERKESEIRYIRLVMSKLQGSPEDIKWLHPRYFELKTYHGIEDERLSVGVSGPQKMASGLIVTMKCVGASFGEKPPLTKKLPATTSVGKLKILCESFFKLKSVKLRLFFQEEGSPLPILLEDEMTSLMHLGMGNGSTILVDEET